MKLETRLARQLKQRDDRGLLRKLIVNRGMDFVSNDYLGFARSNQLHEQFLNGLNKSHGVDGEDVALLGSTGSRLLAGNSSFSQNLEKELAKFHNAEAALLFNSGFDANSGFFSCVPQPGDAIVYDELIHASVHDGLKGTRASSIRSFKHNDAQDLKQALISVRQVKGSANGHVFVSVESLYSMDGDTAPLHEFLQVMDQFPNVHLIVDEAHATGVYGTQGRGWVAHLGLEDRVFARLHTFGKALGNHGACIVGPRVLCDYLVNYCRPLIYSTSLPHHSLVAVQCAYEYLKLNADVLQGRLFELVRAFHDGMSTRLETSRAKELGIWLLPSTSPVQGVVVPGNAIVSDLAVFLQQGSFNVRPIRSPTVPVGTERIRVCIHAHNTVEEIDGLISRIGLWIDERVEKMTGEKEKSEDMVSDKKLDITQKEAKHKSISQKKQGAGKKRDVDAVSTITWRRDEFKSKL